MKKPISFVALLFIAAGLSAQSCIVNVDSLKGQYTGDCRKGRAEGKGTATGIDSYTGHFKNGYPDGQGKYTWKNGSWYEGSWKEGEFDGQGTLRKMGNGTADTALVLTGTWKKGKFIGKFDKPYLVHNATNNINDISIRKINSTAADITITVKSITGGAPSHSNTILPAPKLIGIQIIEGRFEQQVTNETSSVTNKYILRQVTFPFYAIFSFETPGSKLQVEKAAIEILENSNWYVQVSIDN